MRIGSVLKCSFLVGACLGMVRCEEDEISKKCQVICQSFRCDDGVVPDCKSDCIGRMDDAQAIGDVCAKTYDGLLDCLAEVECAVINSWESRRGGPLDYPCKPETDTFLETCSGLWFDKQVKK